MRLFKRVSVWMVVPLVMCIDGIAAGPDSEKAGAVSVMRELARDTSPPLRDIIANLPPSAHSDPSAGAIPNILLDLDDFVAERPTDAPGPAQRTPSGVAMPPVDISVDGMNRSFGGGGVPPDTTGDVGPDHFFQWVNTSFALFNKSTGALEVGPLPGNTFWSGFGGLCESTNRGDPLVLWDDQAQRWVVSQFGFTSTANPPWLQCVAVSTTSDPLGSYHRYAFDYSAFGFNDYGKIGVWTTTDGKQNAYLFSQHEFGATFLGTSYAAVERNRMLNGESAQFIRFGGLDAYGGIPFHLEGEFPLAAGTCPLFVHFSFNSSAYRIWEMCLNWAGGSADFDPNPTLLESDPFTLGLSGIPQLDSTTRLDDFGSNTMYLAVIRGFGPTGPSEAQAVINHAVDVGSDQAGARWVHFGIPTGGGPGEQFFRDSFEQYVAPIIPQMRVIDQGTYAPDSASRWMGGINMDQSANIAFGYNVSSDTMNPEIRIAGRLRTDPPGQLRDEAQCSPTGTGAQTGLFSGRARWGDYATMAVDPDNQCIFWFTNEYYSTTSSSNWNTRICTLEFESCGDPDFVLETMPNAQVPVCGADAEVEVRAGEFGSLGENVSLSQGSVPGGVSLAFDSASIAAGEATGVTVNGSAGLADGQYTAVVDGLAAALNRSTEIHFGVSATTPGQPILDTPGAGATGIVTRPTYAWSGASGATRFFLEAATDAGFSQIVESATVEGTSYTSGVLLDESTTYHWRVTPANYCGDGTQSAVSSFTTGVAGECPAGTAPFDVFFDDVEDDGVAWTTENVVGGAGTLWNKETPPGGTGLNTRAWWADNSSVTSDQRLTSPIIALPLGESPLIVAWDAYHQYEVDGAVNCWDGGFVEIRVNGGAWMPLGNDRNLADAYPGQLSTGNPAAGEFAWCRQPGGGNPVRSVFLLDEFAGDNVEIRFRSASDSNTVGPAPAGWGVDNVVVQSCQD